MNCEEIQPNLLDYSRGLLSGPEAEEIKAHVDSCAECAAVLEEETAFAGRLAGIPDEQPLNDVWALVRAQTKPRRVRPLVWLYSLVSTNVRRAATATVAVTVLIVTLLSFSFMNPAPQPTPKHSAPVIAVNSDDPLGVHTDAVIDYIDDM